MGKKASRLMAEFGDRRMPGGRSASREPVLLACEKCERRLAKEGRFRQISQMNQAMDALAAEARTNGSGLRILAVPCMDVCPKGAMAVASGRAPEDVFIVRTPEDLRAVCEALIESAEGATPPAQGVNEGLSSSDAP